MQNTTKEQKNVLESDLQKVTEECADVQNQLCQANYEIEKMQVK